MIDFIGDIHGHADNSKHYLVSSAILTKIKPILMRNAKRSLSAIYRSRPTNPRNTTYRQANGRKWKRHCTDGQS
ncbi:MAG: hypothetical protein JWQ09_224 [Segetibacter sp.]|nr:hypothetical protein [Segetibacter sp.]